MNIEYFDNPLKKVLEKYSFKDTPGRPTEEPFENWKDDALVKEYFKLNEMQRNAMSCDEVFAVYLRDISQKVNREFYEDVILFVLCF